jgi:hypothetical protein
MRLNPAQGFKLKLMKEKQFRGQSEAGILNCNYMYLFCIFITKFSEKELFRSSWRVF